MQKIFNRLRKEESGQSLVMVVLLLGVLLSFSALVVDVGLLYAEKAKLQNAADAAALAGAQMLPNQESAKSTAIAYAASNGFTISLDDVDVPYDEDDTKVRVEVTNDVPYIFANFLGFDETESGTIVSASAVATKSDINLPAEFGYAIFSESTTAHLGIGKNNWTINGNIHSNYSLDLGKNNNVLNGAAEGHTTVDKSGLKSGTYTVVSNAPIINISADFKTALLDKVKSATKHLTGNQVINDNNIELNSSIYVEGDVLIKSNKFTGKGFIYATGNITLDGNNISMGNSASDSVFIYSEKNITISGNNFTMNGIIYAPNGTIDIQKNNWNVNGRIIAESFTGDILKNNAVITVGKVELGGFPLKGSGAKLVE